jgi:hypothetical protein
LEFAMTANTLRVLEAYKILLRCSGAQTTDFKRQLMLIYLADRECWQRLGQPLIPGPILATHQYGPVNEHALKVLKVRPRLDFVFQELSKAEVGILQRVSISSQLLSTDELHDRACALPEWTPPLFVGGDVIALEQVLKAVGYSPEDAAVIAEGHAALERCTAVNDSEEAVSAVA